MPLGAAVIMITGRLKSPEKENMICPNRRSELLKLRVLVIRRTKSPYTLIMALNFLACHGGVCIEEP